MATEPEDRPDPPTAPDRLGHGADDLDALLPLVYEELRRIAERHMRSERGHHTLQPTALVHEAFTRLAASDVRWNDREHFLALASSVMRRVLVDHARSAARIKRGAGAERVTLTDGVAADTLDVRVLDLDAAMERLAQLDPRKSRVVELCYFGGLTQAEIARALDVSAATIDRELRFARAWLRAQLEPDRS